MWPFLLHHPFKIPAYGLMLAIAIITGIALAKRQAKKEGIDPASVDSLTFWVVVFSVLGSRFLYTFVEHHEYYFAHPIEFFYFRNGGLAFSGSLVAAVITTIVYCKRHALPFWKMIDIMTPPLALGLAIGKMGCFLAGCCYGKVCDLPFAVSFTHPETLARPMGVPLHPAQIYESVAWLLLFALLTGYQKRKRNPGELFFLFAILYGTGRFFLEYFRADPGHIAGITTAQFFSIPLVLAGIFLWVRVRRV